MAFACLRGVGVSKVGQYFGGFSHSELTSVSFMCVFDSILQCNVRCICGRMARCVRVTCDADGGGGALTLGAAATCWGAARAERIHGADLGR